MNNCVNFTTKKIFQGHVYLPKYKFLFLPSCQEKIIPHEIAKKKQEIT